MYARVSTIQGTPERVDEGIRSFRQQVLPGVQEMVGCDGAILLVDRSTGKAVAITLWQTAEDLRASEEAAERLRSQATEDLGGAVPSVDRYEVAVYAVGQPESVPT